MTQALAQTWPLEPAETPPLSERIDHIASAPDGAWMLWPYGKGSRRSVARWTDDGLQFWLPSGTPPGDYIVSSEPGVPPLTFRDLVVTGGRVFVKHDPYTWFERVDGALVRRTFEAGPHTAWNEPIVWGDALVWGQHATRRQVVRTRGEELEVLFELPDPSHGPMVWSHGREGWTRSPLGAGQSAVHAGSEEHGLWVAHGRDVHLSRDLKALTSWEVDLGSDITSVVPNGPDDCWVGTAHGVYAHFDGQTWTQERTPSGPALLLREGPLLGSGGKALGLDTETLRAVVPEAVVQHDDTVLVAGNGLWEARPEGLIERVPPQKGVWPSASQLAEATSPWTRGAASAPVAVAGPPRRGRLLPWRDQLFFLGVCRADDHCVWQLAPDGQLTPLVRLDAIRFQGAHIAVDGDTLWFQLDDRVHTLDLSQPEAPPTERVEDDGYPVLARDGRVLLSGNQVFDGRRIRDLEQPGGRARWPQAWHDDTVLSWTLEGVLLENEEGKPLAEWPGGTVDDVRGPLVVGHLPDHATVLDMRTRETTSHPCLPDGRAAVGEDGTVFQLVREDDGNWLYRSRAGVVERAGVPAMMEACPVGMRGAGAICDPQSQACSAGCNVQLVPRSAGGVWVAATRGTSVRALRPDAWSPVACPR